MLGFMWGALQSRGPGVWVLGPGRKDPLNSTGIGSEGSRMLAAPVGSDRPVKTNTLPRSGDVCTPPFLQLQKLLSPTQGSITSQPPKNTREMHRTAAAQPGDSVQSWDGTVPAPPAEPGCLCLPALTWALTFSAPPGSGTCPTTNKECCAINWFHHSVITVLML